ncbi:hypothetical protein MYCSP_10030 [Mycobacteroides saopaulense]|uniref:hypothetical protein n=1 Tax=Mycobacteroides saopaulense TaxID=1578165 RepID=UPI00071EF8A0|nr:hypothetical protein [Mycobacteroides saopaulense]ALR11741.1 hypothetical protein MYCSP_10030 [Mycobacteroides saopaulense]
MTTMIEPFPHANPADHIEQHISVDDCEGSDTSTELIELSVPLETDPADYIDQRQCVASTLDSGEPLQAGSLYSDQPKPLTPNTLARNRLLLATDIYPTGHQIRIEDHGTNESPEMQQPGTAALDVGEHILFVYTMTADEADTTDSTVTIRIYAGNDHDNLGEQIYSGHLMLTRPQLAVGDALEPTETMLRIPLQCAGAIPLRIFTRTTIKNISGPNEINILLPQDIFR